MFKGKGIKSNDGISLIEIIITIGIVSLISYGYISQKKNVDKSLNSINNTLISHEVKQEFVELLSLPSICYDFFKGQNIDFLSGNVDFVIDGIGDSDAINISKKILDGYEDYKVKDITIKETIAPSSYLNLSSLAIDEERWIPVVVNIVIDRSDSLTKKAFSGKSFQLGKKDGLKLDFVVKNIAGVNTFVGCHSASSTTVLAQRELCQNLGGIAKSDQCYFKKYYSGVKNATKLNETIIDSSANLITFADLACELDKMSTIARASQYIPAITNPTGPGTLSPPLVPKGNLTRLCKRPQGKHIVLDTTTGVVTDIASHFE